jgi:hypothetical protein
MGRSVSFASGSVWVQYVALGDIDALDDFINVLCRRFRRAFPSLDRCDPWLGREDHAVLENRLVYIGVSQYSGLVSIWCVPVPSSMGPDTTCLSVRWAESIEPRVERVLDEMEATRLTRLGTFSNGEGVFRRV